MSIFAGVYSFDSNGIIDEKNKSIILEAITRDDNVVERYSEQGFFLAKADVGAFQDPSFLNEPEEPVAALAGDPILCPSSNMGRSRLSVLKEISSVFLSGSRSILRDCQGIYNLCWYNPQSRVMLLAADKLGVRPLYYYRDGSYLYFSGNLGVLEALNSVSKRMDLIGVSEKALLGSFFGRRTPYADIHVLRGGEYIESQGAESTVSYYFKWDDISTSKSSVAELLDQAYELFNQVVSSRTWREDSVVGFLSGGMDSRAVITSLWAMGKEIFCGNLSFPNSQDAVYPKEYADVLGLKYYAFNRSVDEKFNRNIFQNMMSDLIAQVINKEVNPPRFSRLVFSGEGGSVGLGHVYMNKDIVEKMRKGLVDEVVSGLMNKKYIPKRLLKQGIVPQIKPAIHKDLAKELKSIHADDPARNFFIFLLNNDQRCHLYDHFEDILCHRLEFLAPFYDGRFLELIISTPVDVCLYHEFYTQLFDKFPGEIKSVPWQSYPGHVPCPVTNDRDFMYQWSSNEGNKKFDSKALYGDCRKKIYAHDFPKEIFNRSYLLMAMFLHRLNIKNYSSEFRFFSIYHKYYSICDGKVDL